MTTFKTSRQWSTLLLLLGLMTACSGPSGDEPSPTPEEETPSPTPLPEGTPTPDLQETPSPTPQVTPTPEATPTPSPTPVPPPVVYELDDCSHIQREFWVWDTSVMPPRSVLVPATCRLTGPNAYLYVADDQWDVYVTAELALIFMETYEYKSSPAALYPNRGIFDNDKIIFGDIPDAIDDDPRMYVLLVDIPDYVNSSGEVFSFDGYFNAYDQMTDKQAQVSTFGLYHSNEVEMLYLNSRIRPITDEYTLGVAAHELQHLIMYRYDTSEEIWMSEALAEVAMLVNGYFSDIGWVNRYASNPSVPLVTNTASGSYGAYLLWGMYLYEQFGRDFITILEAEQQDGISGLNRALKTAGSSQDFQALFADWVVANGAQDSSAGDGRFDYSFSEELPSMAEVASFSGASGSYEGAVRAFGADYIGMENLGSSRTLTVTSPVSADLLMRVIKWGPSGVEVVTPRASADGVRSMTLEGGTSWRYLAVFSQINTREVDTGVTLSYSVSVK